VATNVEPAASVPPSERDTFDYEQTRFWSTARDYGFRDLVLTGGSGISLLGAGGVVWLYLGKCIGGDALKALGIAYISLGAALFGIVLAGLAVVAAFFDREYATTLRQVGTLRQSLFAFWWVAALAVAAITASIALTVGTYAEAARAITAPLLGLATFLFFAALFEALALVGTTMRHGIYRAETAARSIEIQRNSDT
jgi:hypothetical protein